MYAQNRQYEFYFDTDNNQTTGCSITHENLEDINGIESKLTIETDEQIPTVLSSTIFSCSNQQFVESPNVIITSLGLNTGNNGEDVFESMLSFSDIGINSSNATKVYYATTHDSAEDVVIEKSPGTPIIINNLDPIQIPGLGIIGLLLLTFFIYIFSKKKIKKLTTLMVYLFLISPLVWAFVIIIDGQTTDWERIETSAIDPVGDTSNPGEFSDITSVYAVSQEDTVYLRMDIVDVENQPPQANDVTATTLEDNQVTIQLTGQDDNNDSLTFVIDQPPTNGTLSTITQINATTAEINYTPNADYNGSDDFTFRSHDGITTSPIATAEINITAVNDAPTFVAGADITVVEDSGLFQQPWATNLVAGPVNETTQQLTFSINTNSNPLLFTNQPQLDTAGNLIFSTFPNTTGATTLNINLLDDGGTTDGGIDTSNNYDLKITLAPVNDPPQITSTPVLSIDTCGADYTYDVNAIDSDIADIISYSLNTALTGMSIDATTGLLTWNAANLQLGTHSITVQATDQALANDTQSFNLIVTECNLPPQIVTTPLTIISEFSDYNYDVDSIDPNTTDILTYSISGGSVFGINEISGLTSWGLAPNFVQSIKGKNRNCFILPSGGIELNGDLSYVPSLYLQVKKAIEKGSEYISPKTIAWDQSHSCLGCHVQNQSLAGLQSSIDKANIDLSAAEYLLDGILTSQRADGSIRRSHPQYAKIQTGYALWALTYTPDYERTFDVRSKALNFYIDKGVENQTSVYWKTNRPQAEWLNEDVAITSIISLSSSRYINDFYKINSPTQEQVDVEQYYLLKLPKITQYLLSIDINTLKSFHLAILMTGLSEAVIHIEDIVLKNQIFSRIDEIDVLLRSRQLTSGGWGFLISSQLADPLTSAWVGIALDYKKPILTDVAVINNIKYLLSVQNLDGTWSTNSGMYNTKLAATSLVMVYLPIGLDFLGSPDISVHEISYDENQNKITVEIQNRGYADVLEDFDVLFYKNKEDLDNLLGSKTIHGLASGDQEFVSIILTTTLTDNIYVKVNLSESVLECQDSNNFSKAIFAKARVEDEMGEYDDQSWLINVVNENEAPVIITEALESAYARNIYNKLIVVDDPDNGDSFSYELVNNPSGLSINSLTGNLHWLPNQDQIGSHTITVKVTDLGGLSDTKELTLDVVPNDQNRNPYIISAPIITAKVDTQYSYQVQGYDPDGDVIGYSLLQAPAGVSMDTITGSIQWIPTLNDVGQHEITLEVHDAKGAKGQQNYQLEVFQFDINNPRNQAPILTSTPVFTAEQNQPYSYQIQANDPDGDSLIYAKVAGPAEISVDSNTGLLTWIPTNAGDQTISVSVSDGQYAIVQQWTITISEQGTNPSNTAPFISSAPQYDVNVAAHYSYQVNAVDLDGDPLTYQMTQAPAGMVIDASGYLTWQPNTNQLGTHSIAITVSDDRGASTTQSYDLVVLDGANINHAPQITSTPSVNLSQGNDYTYQIIATDADADPLNYALISAPVGMQLNNNTHTLEWPNATTGHYPIEITVSDQQYTVTQQWMLRITDGTSSNNQPPTIVSTPIYDTEISTNYTYQVIAVDAENDPLGYQLLQAPNGMQISLTGAITWQANNNQIGTHNISIRVLDDHANYVIQDYTLTVNDPSTGNNQNHAPQISSLPSYILQKGDIYSYQIQATDSDGDTLSYNLINAPNGMTLDANTAAINWQATQIGDYPIEITVSDAQYTVVQQWTLRVIESDLGLFSSLQVTPQAAVINQPVEIFIQPQGGVGAVSITATIDNQPLSLDANNHASTTFANEGLYIVQAQITDDLETITLEKTITISETLDLFAPEIDIHTPEDGSENTGFIDFNISVNDPNISQWHLGYRTAEAGQNAPRTQIASGSTNVDHQNVVSFDTSQLRNGIYVFVLDAVDTFGQSTSVAHSIFIEGDLKIGNFQISFEDLNIPVAGIPVSITRSYDTRNRNADEAFGKGWEIGYQSLQLTESLIPGLGWYMATESYNIGPVRLPRYCIQSIGDRLVSIRMPDDTLEKFKVKAKTLNTAGDGRINCQDITPPNGFTIEFIPQGDTNSQLTAEGANANYVVRNGNIEPLADQEIYDPNKYTLTLQDGTIYAIDQGFNLTGIETTDGNSLTFTHNGIQHNNGYAVQFIRDSQDRITAIRKPNGEEIHYNYDANGNLASHTDLMGNTTTFTYILDHYLQDINDPRGIMVARNEYDADGRLIAHIDADGNRIEYTHDIQGRTETIKDRNGNSSVFVYDNAGSVIAETNALGETTFHEYNDIRLETKRIDPLGNETTWTYDNAGNQLTETDALGNTTTTTYNQKGEVLTETDAAGNIVLTNEFIGDYDPQTPSNPQHGYGQLRKFTDSSGNATEFKWLSGVTNPSPSGRSITIGTGFIDAFGNRYTKEPLATGGTNDGINGSTTDLNGLKQEMVYDDEANVISTDEIIIDENDVEIARYTTTFEYNENGDITQTTDAQGNITKIEYNQLNQISANIDADGKRTSFDYNDRGLQIKTTYPDATTELIKYDNVGNVTSTTDRAGRITKTIYDVANRITQVIMPDATPNDDSDNPIIINAYDAASRLTSTTDENGNITTYEFDAKGNNTKVTDSLGNITQYAYDANSRRISSTDALNHTSKFVYDLKGNLTQTILPDNTPNDDSDNPSMLAVYDKRNRKISESDLAGKTTQFVFDAGSKLTEVIDSSNQSTTYGYDQRGNKTSQTDANGHITTWAYNELSQVVNHTLPEGQTESFGYDAKGRLISHTDFNGDTTSSEYNDISQLVKTTYADGSIETFNYYPSGQTQTITTAQGTISYVYDAQDRIITETKHNGDVLNYTYDLIGNKTQTSLSKGALTKTWNYQYDALNRLSAVTDDQNRSYINQYNAIGLRVKLTQDNGIYVTYQYDEQNRLISQSTFNSNDVLLNSYTYTLSQTGLRENIVEDTGRNSAYVYDDLYRLTTETITDTINGNHIASYQYDPVGNRTASTINGVSTAYSYNTNDQVLTAGAISYQYNANGSITQENDDGTISNYAYNKKNELTQLTTGADTYQYQYDPHGVRNQAIINGQTTQYLIDHNQTFAQVLVETTTTSQTVYTYGDDLLAEENSTGIHYYQYDGLGSTRELTDLSQSITDSYNYDAYGVMLNQTGITENNYLYTGEQFDPNMGFYYLRARYMNPAIGRFTSMDSFAGSAGTPISLNKYVYANANPINNTDPSGFVSLAEFSAASRIRGALNNYTINIGFNFLDPANAEENIKNDLILGAVAGGGAAAFKLFKFFSSKFRKACNSFAENTLISTELGFKDIEDIQIGDKVWAFNEAENTVTLQEVIHTIVGQTQKQTIDITLASGESIQATDEHPIYAQSKGLWDWVEAKNLKQDMLLMDRGGNTLSILNITHNSKKVQVYNLTVANGHTYYVTKDEVLVHNGGVCLLVTSLRKNHILEGNVNGFGKASGWHSRSGGINPAGRRIVGNPSTPDINGVYSAKIQIKDTNGIWKNKDFDHTFFPDSWDGDRVISEIQSAYVTSPLKSAGVWKARSASGILIQGRIDAAGKIISAFPLKGL